jgi:hypothetical protein
MKTKNIEASFWQLVGDFPFIRKLLAWKFNKRMKDNPELALSEFFGNIERDLDIGDGHYSEDDLKVIANVICDIIPAMKPYKTSVVNLLVNKYKHDGGGMVNNGD